MSDGFQYLEQRDDENKVTNKGVVSKDSMLTTAKNDGIYDVIAEDLRALKEMIDNLKPDISEDDVTAIKKISQQIDKAYLDVVKVESSVHADSARAQDAAEDAKKYRDEVVRVNELADGKIQEMKTVIEAVNQTITNLEVAMGKKEVISRGEVGSAITFHGAVDGSPNGSIRIDDKGEFHISGLIHGSMFGNVKYADEAGKLHLTPKINGVPFDGTSDISIDAGLMDKKNLLVTLIAKDWGGDRTYKISHPLIKKTTDILMIPQVGTSQTVYSMISDACITCAEQEDGYIVLKALGTPPDQDVNVNLLML